MSITTFAVAGAAGRLGRHVVDARTERGHRVVPMSRAAGVDIIMHSPISLGAWVRHRIFRAMNRPVKRT
ncbi:hypothetical protein AB0B56_27820 [Streptosporangium canum]|uniref:hypothetical protein n=1 Tax=Streptosporangium canum TaxID=324952 RepID=UPI003422F7E0